ncbi:MAG TPA: alanine-tRNA synthetase second additional domain-containing protein [Clostridia bacterium]|nr:alanine-tRNA synthetase second additional domain-containing protein [Clostridia bacterium]
MPYSDRMQRGHLYSVYFAPRGLHRMADLGMQVAQQYLSPFDKLIGLVGEAGSGKSMFIKGMFPGLELTNDDEGVNVRPLPLLSVEENDTGFYTPHTYHVDIRFESAFTQMHVLADAILEAITLGKRVVVEHFDLIYPFMSRNAHLLIGIGEEVIITRPTLFGPEPEDLAKRVFETLPFRKMIHSAEEICGYFLELQGIEDTYRHEDVRHGFVFSFTDKPEIDLEALERDVNEMIAQDVPISFADGEHIYIGDHLRRCSGPRMHVKNTSEIEKITIKRELLKEPITDRYLMVCVVGEHGEKRINDLNKITIIY